MRTRNPDTQEEHNITNHVNNLYSVSNGRHQATDTSSYAPIGNNNNTTTSQLWKVWSSFWFLGLLNNASYVLMVACAKNISDGATGLVFLANVIPGFLVKLTAPYWFDHVSYHCRLQWATWCMIISFMLVATARQSLGWQLVGVAFGSTQVGLGEATLLALAGKRDGEYQGSDTSASSKKGYCLNCFSSGTGMAGVFGFLWKWLWYDRVGLSLQWTLYLALSLAIAYWSLFQYLQRHSVQAVELTVISPISDYSVDDEAQGFDDGVLASTVPTTNFTDSDDDHTDDQELDYSTSPRVELISELTFLQRFHKVLSLWPYIPLFAVYAAEYAMQAGTWTAIGFPVSDKEARDKFFEISNWMYQCGVFLSRSSGTLGTPPMWLLWLMPTLQCINLGVFLQVGANASSSVLYVPWIMYSGAFYTGLLGGAVYISGYMRICADLPLEHREFALSTTSLAEGIGIIVADALGLVIQACLYEVNGLNGALLSCPI